MNSNLFSQIVASAQVGTALLIVGVALWLIVFRNLTVSKR